jgi:probable phosphoglycerate mutase
LAQPTTLVFIRHGQTDWNVQGRIQGQLDEPLNLEGRAQATRLRDLVSQGQPSVLPTSFDVAYSSPLVRAWRTAEPLAAYFGLDLQQAPALAERHFGELQGVCYEEMPLRFP